MRVSVMLACVAGTVLLTTAAMSVAADQPWRSHQAWRTSYIGAEPTPATRGLAASPTPSSTKAGEEEDLAYASEDTPPASADANSAACCDDPCCECHRCRRARMIGSTCNMPPHYAYFPAMHGYYYFRPYNHSHVATQQTYARMWGEDPANPYGNRIFQTVYEQYRADASIAQPPMPGTQLLPQPPLPEQPPVEQ
ncbi:MAG: hypothetical protein U1E05_22500 [Patescibacteria group bacterium]|nr:hypothetical protein [Patescibacteria group bacterium]